MYQTLELMAVLVSAAYGILRARQKEMDFVGVFAMAFIVAFGGGTLRDLFLDRHPLFWIRREEYPVIVFGLALATCLVRRLPRRLDRALNLPDALGLGLFAIVGTEQALDSGVSLFIASLFGVVTGAFGGVIADVVCNEVPRLFRAAPLYATCAFAGSWVFLGLQLLPNTKDFAALAGISVTVLLRLAAVRWNLSLPTHTHDSG